MKEIPLTQGKVAIIDDEDSDLARKKWYAGRDGNTFYAMRGAKCNGRWTTEKMHRSILARKLGRALLLGEITDHIDGDGLNNRRDNLRIATNQANQWNQGAQRDGTSGYKGVHRERTTGKWRARIVLNRKSNHLGCFVNKIDAARAYNEAATLYHGEFARLNKIPA